MNTMRSRGFTLIELLTVIAIIAILAALTAATLPKVLEKARVTRLETDFKALEKALAVYASNHTSFPPGNDYLMLSPEGVGTDHIDYMTRIGLKSDGDKSHYDSYADGNPAQPHIYPFVYVPVNLGQFATVKKYLEGQTDVSAKYYAKGISLLPLKLSPPASYDAYVLLSVGPTRTTSKDRSPGKTLRWDYGGICVPDFADEPTYTGIGNGGIATEEGEPLWLTGLRVYYRATRDANDDRELDFDWRARTRQGQGSKASYAVKPGPPADNLIYHLPDEVLSGGALDPDHPTDGLGPLIFVSPK